MLLWRLHLLARSYYSCSIEISSSLTGCLFLLFDFWQFVCVCNLIVECLGFGSGCQRHRAAWGSHHHWRASTCWSWCYRCFRRESYSCWCCASDQDCCGFSHFRLRGYCFRSHRPSCTSLFLPRFCISMLYVWLCIVFLCDDGFCFPRSPISFILNLPVMIFGLDLSKVLSVWGHYSYHCIYVHHFTSCLTIFLISILHCYIGRIMDDFSALKFLSITNNTSN